MMNTNLLVFILISLINVILSTVKSILTIKASNLVAAIINAIAYAFNAIVMKQIIGFDNTTTITVVFITNLVGVYFSKWLMDFTKKERVWKIEATVDETQSGKLNCMLLEGNIPFTVVPVERSNSDKKYYSFGIYSSTQKESSYIKFLLKETKAKYVVFENRGL